MLLTGLCRREQVDEARRWASSIRAAATTARHAQQQALDVARGLAVSVGGYRVLRKPESERHDYTAYKLQVTPRPGSAVCGARPWVVYKRYSEFRALSAALAAVGGAPPPLC